MEESASAVTTVGGTKSPQQPAAEPFPWTLEVALSGGGLRASAYALGALLYLVHSGLNVKVKNISSVSGGSITNAFVACECDFSKPVDFSAFLKVVSPLARKIAFSGLLQRWQSWAWGILVGIVALALLVCLLVLAYAFVGSWLVVRGSLGPPELVSYSPLVLSVVFILSLVLPLFFFFRSLLSGNWMEAILPQWMQSWVWGIAVANVALLGALAFLFFAFFESVLVTVANSPNVLAATALIVLSLFQFLFLYFPNVALLCSLVLLVFACFGSWGPGLVANSPYVLAAAPVLLLGLLLLLKLRSWPIDRWMETILPAGVTLGDRSQRHFNHIFCATDLHSGQPFFFSTADDGRIFSPIYGVADAPGVPVVRSVRASAAFPPAIPPISFDVKRTWLIQEGWGFKESQLPAHRWLTDGGAFNNFGTEWHLWRRELHSVHRELFKRTNRKDRIQDMPTWLRERYGQVQLIIDASRLDQEQRLSSLRFPIIGFVAYVFRTMNVMYGSTLAGRSTWSELAVSRRIRQFPRKWLAQHSESRFFKHAFERYSEPYYPERDDDTYLQGALQLYVAHSRPFDHIDFFWSERPCFDEWADSKRIHDWREKNRIARSALARHWPWTSDKGLIKPEAEEVPTTFRKLGRDRTLKLIIEGYVKTREVLFCSLAYEGPPIPDRETFESLLE